MQDPDQVILLMVHGPFNNQNQQQQQLLQGANNNITISRADWAGDRRQLQPGGH